MIAPIETTKGRIVELLPNGTVKIEAQVNVDLWVKREYKEVYIEFIDSRPLSTKQRKMCWALIGEIADWQGQSKGKTLKETVNEARKVDFLINELGENADRLFSLSNAPMSLVCAYQRYLIRFIIENDVPTTFSLLEYADDIQDYLYRCLINKKCFVCGKPGELHHISHVGMGNDREEICHIGMEAVSVCREHHEVPHRIGEIEFKKLYHIDKGIEIDRTIAKIYKLKSKK